MTPADALNYILSIVTSPTPAQEWLANVQVPEPEERCAVCGEVDCEDEEHERPERDEITESKRYEKAYGED